MKNPAKIVGIAIIAFIVIFSCNRIVSKTLEVDLNKSIVDTMNAKNEVRNTIKTLSTSLPRTIDERTTISKVEYIEDENKVVFNYSLIGVEKEEVKSKITSLKTKQLIFIKENGDNQVFIKARVVFEYKYFDENANLLGEYQILPNEY
ncbi:hypothetical protein BWK59_00855 [Flavobacterium davisii]|uniref:Lipoprotein n=1 Tax=Flavobacterium davisii TaxID=2906077 RepID=A0A246GLW5_9FLAO|nr:hypothetical protein [Flavobacterium davisii]OWP85316.1 hypothetical protein BWK59_00855 [Flavobacterium davisii]